VHLSKDQLHSPLSSSTQLHPSLDRQGTCPKVVTLLFGRSLLQSRARIRLMASDRMACCALLLLMVGTLTVSPQAGHV